MIGLVEMGKILVLYVFHAYNKRVEDFIKNCIFEDDNIDFFVISNSKSNVFHVPPYVKTLYRDNIGYDFGGWSEALLTDNLYKNYDRFIFANSSIKGRPYIASYYNGKWTDIYLNGLKDNIKLFGTTINTDGEPLIKAHVQSYVFAMDKYTLQYLIECEIFSVTNYAKTFGEAVQKKEYLMSRRIIEAGWNIGSLLRYYDNVDFTFSTKSPEDYNIKFLGDVMFSIYRNRLWHDEQLVFIKGNRDM
jgi:hypothetical protein